MPSTTRERKARWWPETDETGIDTACDFLTNAGYELLHGWVWLLPCPDHVPTSEERDAMLYLIEEWDFDGCVRSLDT